MRSAVVVSTARTPIGRAYRGAFNNTQSQALGGHVIAEAVKRASLAPAEIDDVVIGAALQQGAQGFNLARQCALAAGLPDSVAGMTVDRQCSSGLMAIATAAKQIVDDGMEITVGGGLDSISLVQNEHANRHRAKDPTLVERIPALYMAMIETAKSSPIATAFHARRRTNTRYDPSNALRPRSWPRGLMERLSLCRPRCWSLTEPQVLYRRSR
jgi:acetyl-CoA C-acetyltransferase